MFSIFICAGLPLSMAHALDVLLLMLSSAVRSTKKIGLLSVCLLTAGFKDVVLRFL